MNSIPPVLYHYCSTSAFHAIVSNRAIRLSALSMSNDYLEGRLLPQIIERLCDMNGIHKKTREEVRISMGTIAKLFEGIGFCLSENGDLLSQWRGYADDARGVAIGFSREYFEKLAQESRSVGSGFTLDKVLYDLEDQVTVLAPLFEKVMEHSSELSARLEDKAPGGVAGVAQADRSRKIAKARKHLEEAAHEQQKHMFVLKSPAFREECEWRLLASDIKFLHLSRGEFRPCGDRLIPFETFRLLELAPPPIVDVVLGPKHFTPVDVVQSFMSNNGFKQCGIRNSEASYR